MTTARAPYDLYAKVNELPAERVAEMLGLTRARERHKFNCPVHGGRDSLHAYSRGFRCYGACDKSFSAVDLAAAVWGMSPADACKALADQAGVWVSDTPSRLYKPPRGRRDTSSAPRPLPAPSRPERVAPGAAGMAELRADGMVPAAAPALYAVAFGALQLTDAGTAYLETRGFEGGPAADYGFRSLDGRKDWQALTDALAGEFLAEEIAHAGLATLPWGGRVPALVIPYWHHGALIALRFRNLTPNADGNERYRTLGGTNPAMPFNADDLTDPSAGELHVCEGELDAYTLYAMGHRVIGIPGTGGWRVEWTPYLRTLQRVVLWFDGDEGGRKATAKFADLMQASFGSTWLREHVRSAALPPETDVNAFHADPGLRADLHGYLAARPWR